MGKRRRFNRAFFQRKDKEALVRQAMSRIAKTDDGEVLLTYLTTEYIHSPVFDPFSKDVQISDKVGFYFDGARRLAIKLLNFAED